MAGALAPFMLFVFAAVLIAGLALGVGLGVGGAAVLKVFVSRKGRHLHDQFGGGATLWRLGLAAAWACGGLLLGLVLARALGGDHLRGPMATATMTERELFAACFFIPLGVG